MEKDNVGGVLKWPTVRNRVSQDNASASLKVVVPRELNRFPAQFMSTMHLIYVPYN